MSQVTINEKEAEATETYLYSVQCQCYCLVTCYLKKLNTCLSFISVNLSLTEINCWHICFTSILSSLSWWTWHTAILLSLTCAILVLGHVFSLLRALKLISASADDPSMTKSSLTRVSTWSNRTRPSLQQTKPHP